MGKPCCFLGQYLVPLSSPQVWQPGQVLLGCICFLKVLWVFVLSTVGQRGPPSWCLIPAGFLDGVSDSLLLSS